MLGSSFVDGCDTFCEKEEENVSKLGGGGSRELIDEGVRGRWAVNCVVESEDPVPETFCATTTSAPETPQKSHS